MSSRPLRILDVGLPVCDDLPAGSPYLSEARDVEGRPFITVPCNVVLTEDGVAMLTKRLKYYVTTIQEMQAPQTPIKSAVYVDVMGNLESIKLIVLSLQQLKEWFKSTLQGDIHVFFFMHDLSAKEDQANLHQLVSESTALPPLEYSLLDMHQLDAHIDEGQRTYDLMGTMPFEITVWTRWRLKVETHMVESNSCTRRATARLQELQAMSLARRGSASAFNCDILELKLPGLLEEGRRLATLLEKQPEGATERTLMQSAHYQSVARIIECLNRELHELLAEFQLIYGIHSRPADPVPAPAEESPVVTELNKVSGWFWDVGLKRLAYFCHNPGHTRKACSEYLGQFLNFKDVICAEYISRGNAAVEKILGRGECEGDGVGSKHQRDAEDLGRLMKSFGCNLDAWHECMQRALKWHTAAEQIMDWVVRCSEQVISCEDSIEQAGPALEKLDAWIAEHPEPAEGTVKELASLSRDLCEHVYFETELGRVRSTLSDVKRELSDCRLRLVDAPGVDDPWLFVPDSEGFTASSACSSWVSAPDTSSAVPPALEGGGTVDSTADLSVVSAGRCGEALSRSEVIHPQPAMKIVHSWESSVSMYDNDRASVAPMKKLGQISNELIGNLEKFIHDLTTMETSYGMYLRIHTACDDDYPSCLSDNVDILTDDLSNVLAFTRDALLPALKARRDDPLALGNVIVTMKDGFEVFSTYYCAMSKRSEVLKEAREALQHVQAVLEAQHGLDTYLLMPHMQLIRYESFLQRMVKTCPRTWRHTEECKDLKLALKIIRSLCTRGNALVGIEKLDFFLDDLDELGELVRMEHFAVCKRGNRVSQLKSRTLGRHAKESYRTAFLFETAILLAKRIEEKVGDSEEKLDRERLHFKRMIKLQGVRAQHCPERPDSFRLCVQRTEELVFKNDDLNVAREWVLAIGKFKLNITKGIAAGHVARTRKLSLKTPFQTAFSYWDTPSTSPHRSRSNAARMVKSTSVLSVVSDCSVASGCSTEEGHHRPRMTPQTSGHIAGLEEAGRDDDVTMSS